MRKTRIGASVIGLLIASLLAASTVFAMSSAVSPGYQSVTSGQTAYWGGAWGGATYYDVSFCYGDGSCAPTVYNTTQTSAGYSHAFIACFTTQKTQTLTAWKNGMHSQYSASTALTTVIHGPC